MSDGPHFSPSLTLWVLCSHLLAMHIPHLISPLLLNLSSHLLTVLTSDFADSQYRLGVTGKQDDKSCNFLVPAIG